MRKYCHSCGKEIDSLVPFKCKHCNQYFCKHHYLPENHSCPDFKPGSWIKLVYAPLAETDLTKTPKIGKTIKKERIVKLSTTLIIIFILICAVSVGGFYVLNQSYSELSQEKSNLESELETTRNQLNDSNVQLSIVEIDLAQIEIIFQENDSMLQELRTGDEYHLHDPTYKEVIELVENDDSEDAKEFIDNAKGQGLRCAKVNVNMGEGQYILVAFDTVDTGMVYFESETHYRVFPEVDKNYFDCVENQPYGPSLPSDNDTITRILFIW